MSHWDNLEDRRMRRARRNGGEHSPKLQPLPEDPRRAAIRAALEAAAQHVRAKYNRGDTCHPIQLQHEILLLSPDDILKRL